MDERRHLYEDVLDYALYAPVGVVLSLVEDLPELIGKGRAQLAGRVGTANVVGKFAVSTLKRRVEKFLANNEEHGPVVDTTADEAQNATTLAAREPAVDVGALAIPGYDALAASQVVARLEGLSRAELALVGAYEQSTRGRRTILLRIAQLEAEHES